MPPKQKFPSLFPILKTRCPHCSEEVIFGLASATVEGSGFFREKIFFLLCGDCGHKHLVEDGESEDWQRMRKAYAGLDAGKLTQDQFNTILEATNNPALHELLEDANVWTCPCGEENPMNFAACWSCGKDATGPVKDSSDIHIDPG